MKTLKYISLCFILLSVLIYLAGKVTYSFKYIEGEVKLFNKLVNPVHGEYGRSGKSPLVSYRGKNDHLDTWYSIRYSYIVDGINYTSGFIGLYIPSNINIDINEAQQKIKVYYAPFKPSISVLKQGSDIRLTLILFLFGLCLLIIYWWLLSIIKKAYNENEHSH